MRLGRERKMEEQERERGSGRGRRLTNSTKTDYTTMRFPFTYLI